MTQKYFCCLLLSLLLASIGQLYALSIIKNVNDFHGQPFVHIDFEASSSQGSAADINSFLQNQAIGGATYSGPSPTTSSSIANNGSSLNGGFDGGAVSGQGHLRGSNFLVQMNFSETVDAFGFFVGGLHFLSSTSFSVTLEDSSTHSVSIGHLALAQNSDPSTEAISGFVGADAGEGPRIRSFSWQHNSDTHSLDDIYFGTANFSNTVGQVGFAESGAVGGTTLQAFPEEENGVVPEAQTLYLLTVALVVIFLCLKC